MKNHKLAMRNMVMLVYFLLSTNRYVFSSSLTDKKCHNRGQNTVIATLLQFINQETIFRLSMTKKIDVIKDDISTLQKTVTTINDESQTELGNIKKENRLLKEQLLEYEKEITFINITLKQQQMELETVKEENRFFKEHLLEYVKQTTNITLTLKQHCQMELGTVKEENRLFKEQLAEYDKQVTNINFTLKQQFNTELGIVKEENRLFKEQLLEYEKQNTNYNFTLERMRQGQNDLFVESRIHTGEIKDLKVENKLLKYKSSVYEKQINNINDTLQQIQKEQFVTFTEVNNTTENIKNLYMKNELLLKRQSLKYEKQINNINVTLKQIQKEQFILYSGINNSTENIKNLCVKNEFLLKRQGLEYEKHIADINVTLLQLQQDQNTTLQSETNSLYKKVKDISVQSKAFKERMSKVEIELAHSNNTIKHLRNLVQTKGEKEELKSSSIVAFYAYLRYSIQNTAAGQTVIFNIVVTNKEGGYNGKTGIFIAPVAGMYVFSWTIACDHLGRVFTELRVNSKSVGNILTQGSNSREYRTVTGVVVTVVDAGDTVFVRTRPENGKPTGDIVSYLDQKTSFSGWKLN